MKIIRKVSTTIITCLLVLLASFNVYNFICIHLFHQDLTTIGGYAVLEVVSGSMEPTIHVGDLIVIDKNAPSYRQGDIVTFKDVDGSFVTHRIVKIDKETMVTKGDANHSADDMMSVSSLVGKYTLRIPGAGKIMAAFKSPFVMIMIFIIGVLTCVFVSTDKQGKPILEKEEKEYLEFLDYKKRQGKILKEIHHYTTLENDLYVNPAPMDIEQDYLDAREFYQKARGAYEYAKKRYVRTREIFLQARVIYKNAILKYECEKAAYEAYQQTREVYLEAYQNASLAKEKYMKAYQICMRAKNEYTEIYQDCVDARRIYTRRREIYEKIKQR